MAPSPLPGISSRSAIEHVEEFSDKDLGAHIFPLEVLNFYVDTFKKLLLKPSLCGYDLAVIFSLTRAAPFRMNKITWFGLATIQIQYIISLYKIKSK